MSAKDHQIDRTPPGLPRGSVTISRMPRSEPPEEHPVSEFRREPVPHMCLVVDGYDPVLNVERLHNLAIRRWREQLKNSDFPYSLRATFTVTKGNREYRYPGTYWYRWDPKAGVKGRWVYVGKELPSDVDLSKIPAPPKNPLEGFEYERVGAGRDILVAAGVLRQYRHFFDGYVFFDVTRSVL